MADTKVFGRMDPLRDIWIVLLDVISSEAYGGSNMYVIVSERITVSRLAK